MGGRTMNVDLQIITRIQTSSSSSSSSSSNLNLNPVTVTVPAINNGKEGDIDKARGSASHSVFGPVPSQSEVQTAISLFQNFMLGVFGPGSNSKWLIEMLDSPISRILLSYGIRRLYEAFQLLQTDTFVQRLVVSLSSDKALWDAIMNNEVVRNLIEPLCLCLADTERQHVTSEEPNMAITILKWVWDIMKAKAIEFVDKFLTLMNEIDNPAKEKNKDQLEDKVRTSLLISILILLIVVVARAN